MENVVFDTPDEIAARLRRLLRAARTRHDRLCELHLLAGGVSYDLLLDARRSIARLSAHLAETDRQRVAALLAAKGGA